ncbi:MAG: cysteine--tRNA ligase, partial [Candidatus Levyibacteriota bacterium]
LYNSLSRSVEEFEPIDPPRVGMYTCGPTVYDFMHIGNLRTFIMSDLLLRTLKFNGFKVKSVQNITDIDDKIIKRASERGEDVSDVVQEFTKYFIEDVAKLNISIEDIISPRATDYIPQMIEYIGDLIKKEFAYEKEGSVYFDISKFEGYGKLSGVSGRELKTGTRSLSDNYTKDDIADFALWKKDSEFGFESPWGKGRPGWHIECSVMSQENLGDTFDIHAGGVDLLFPHHENEIAQSEAKTGEKFANYFVHGAHLFVDGQKMSKSLNNFYTLRDVTENGFEPLALRYLYLQTHYRQEMNFTWDALEAAQTALKRMRDEALDPEDGIISAEFERRFKDAINDDLNMPQALAVVWEMLKSNILEEDKAVTLLEMDKVLGLNLKKKKEKIEVEIPEEVKRLVLEREQLRKERRYDQADQRRNRIRKLGFDIDDREDGTTEIRKI